MDGTTADGSTWERRLDAPGFVLLLWAAVAALTVVLHLPDPFARTFPDPDSLMRLVQVRDLLASQDWFDLRQHRLGAGEATPMHWSRLVDAPIAVLMLAGRALGGDLFGERLALIAWPILTMLAFFALAVWAARALGGRATLLPAAVLPAASFDVLTHMKPGRLDHHNVQMVLLLLALAAMLRMRERPLLGGISGLAAAAMMTVGVETIVYVAVFCAGAALAWLAAPEAFGPAARRFGIAFAAGLVAAWLAFAEPQNGFVCDALSRFYVLAGASGGLGLAVLAHFGSRWPSVARAVALAALAVAAAGSAIAVDPQCLAGPLAELSPQLRAEWLAMVAEAQPVWSAMPAAPVPLVAKLAPPLLALALALRRLAAGASFEWLLAAGLLLAGCLLGFYQVRALPFANAAAIPILAAWLGQVRQRGLRTPGRHDLSLFLAAWLAALPGTWFAVGSAVTALVGVVPAEKRLEKEIATRAPAAAAMSRLQRECLAADSAAALAALPPGLILTPIFAGPAILAISHHSVVAAQYHRGGDLILDVVRAIAGPPQEAERTAARHAVDYVAVCRTSEETELTIAEAPDGFLAGLVRGAVPAWLEPVPAPADAPLALYRVRR